ncbi:hypothetical protein Hamer_G003845, partial [Homarus americanus]
MCSNTMREVNEQLILCMPSNFVNLLSGLFMIVQKKSRSAKENRLNVEPMDRTPNSRKCSHLYTCDINKGP